jgi:hypothetical protein
MNYRLELSMHDAVEACTEVNHFKVFMDKLYVLYSTSPKNRRLLEVCAAGIEGELLKIGRVLDVRWVASSYRAVKAVWISYPALHAHFSTACADPHRDSKERAQFKGLATKLSNSSFLLNLALMLDALEELSDLSEALQAADINVYKAVRLITRQIEVFVCRKTKGGAAFTTAEQAVSSGSFEQVDLHTRGGPPLIKSAQFYQALADSMAARLLPQSEQHIVQAVQTVFPGTWPTVVPPEYGEPQLKQICVKFEVPHSNELKQQYRDYKDSKGCDLRLVMKQFVFAVDTLPVSTAACERGFSRMNVICSPLQTQLTIKHISSLMFIAMVGPPMNAFDPAPYVTSWLAKGRHAATDMGKTMRETDAKDDLGQLAF